MVQIEELMFYQILDIQFEFDALTSNNLLQLATQIIHFNLKLLSQPTQTPLLEEL